MNKSTPHTYTVQCTWCTSNHSVSWNGSVRDGGTSVCLVCLPAMVSVFCICKNVLSWSICVDFMHSSLCLSKDGLKSRWAAMIKADMVDFLCVWVGGWMSASAYVHFIYFPISLVENCSSLDTSGGRVKSVYCYFSSLWSE